MSNNIKMREDLASEGLLIPAGLSYSNYDDLHDDFYLTASELEGAQMESDENPDNHPFCKARLSDGRIVYLISVDLDFF